MVGKDKCSEATERIQRGKGADLAWPMLCKEKEEYQEKKMGII